MKDNKILKKINKEIFEGNENKDIISEKDSNEIDNISNKNENIINNNEPNNSIINLETKQNKTTNNKENILPNNFIQQNINPFINKINNCLYNYNQNNSNSSFPFMVLIPYQGNSSNSH